jgi:hypothetical protein
MVDRLAENPMSKRQSSIWSLSLCGLLTLACDRADTNCPCEDRVGGEVDPTEKPTVKASPW